MSGSKPSGLAVKIIGGMVLLSLAIFALPRLFKPSGERIGDIDLVTPGTSLPVSAQAGDRLTFSGSVTVGTRHLLGTTRRSRATVAFGTLVDSTLTVRVAPPDGREIVVTCPFLKGSMEKTWEGDDMTELEIFNDCEVLLAASATYRVSAEVAWAPDVALRRAVLEIRSERAN